MQKHALMLMKSAFILASGTIAVSAQQTPGRPMAQQHPQAQQQQQQQQERRPIQSPSRHVEDDDDRDGPYWRHRVWRRGATVNVMADAIERGIMMRVIFSLMDSDGDGTVSFDEFKAADERLFKGMDANKDGRLTQEEIQAFMRLSGDRFRGRRPNRG